MTERLNNEYALYIKYHRKFYSYAFEYFTKYIKCDNEMLSFIDAIFKEYCVSIQYKNNNTEEYQHVNLSVDNFINFIKDNYEEEKYYN